MTVKSIQSLVNSAMQEIKTITANEAYEMLEGNNCNLIDIREINELENTGKVEGATHIPRGMLEVYLDPNSPAIHNGQLDLNIDNDEFFKSIKEQSIKDKLIKLTTDAFEKEVFGTPTFIVNNKTFWGQDRLEYALEEVHNN